jgi:hypothetical protein
MISKTYFPQVYFNSFETKINCEFFYHKYIFIFLRDLKLHRTINHKCWFTAILLFAGHGKVP